MSGEGGKGGGNTVRFERGRKKSCKMRTRKGVVRSKRKRGQEKGGAIS